MSNTENNTTKLDLSGLFKKDVFLSSESFDLERKIRLENQKKILQFGIPFLDDCFRGIFPDDLIVLGASTGLGKTQIATLIAKHNALNGKRVLFFALEASPHEIIRRIKYNLICEKFYSKPYRPSIKLNFIDWYSGKFDEYIDPIEKEIEPEIKKLDNLSTYYKGIGDFTHESFHKIFAENAAMNDLIIVDHLHYFDILEANENQGIKQIVKTIRDCAIDRGKPVILLSHIRKLDRKYRPLVPAIEDFHGSSDISKIATKAFTLAPAMDSSINSTKRKSFIRTLKCRMDGSRTGVTAEVTFDIKTQDYERDYKLGKLNEAESEFIEVDLYNKPDWAVNSI